TGQSLGGAEAAMPAVVAGKVSIAGKVFYNDRRDHGLFSARKDLTGATGAKCGTAGVRADGTACATNWLGAQYMVVDVIERDSGYFAPLAWDCKQEETLASVAVNSDGSFTATFTATDACDS